MRHHARSKTSAGLHAGTLLGLVLLVASCSAPPGPTGPVEVEIDGVTATVREARRFSGRYVCATGTTVDVQAVVGTTVRTSAGTSAGSGDGDGAADFVLVAPRDEGRDDLIVFAHGYRDPALDAGFWTDAPGDLGTLLAVLDGPGTDDLSAGVVPALELAVCPFQIPFGPSKDPHAFGASSYSENGYAVERGVPESHLVGALYAHYFGNPERTYATGASLGGIIALALAEGYPHRYDGALPACGPIGGSLPQLRYVADVEAMFRHFYPGVLPGSVLEPIDLPYGDPSSPGDPTEPGYEPTIVGEIVAAVARDPAGLDAIARVEVDAGGARRPLLQADPDDASTRLRALLDAFYYAGVGKADILARVEGSPIDNVGASYLLDGTPLSDVPRYAGDPDALAYYRAHYQPAGDLQVPTVAVHNRYDPVVPAWHQDAYEAAVAATGRSNALLTVEVPIDGIPTGTEAFAHCGFAPEVVAAFAELADWATTGVRPTLPGGSLAARAPPSAHASATASSTTSSTDPTAAPPAAPATLR